MKKTLTLALAIIACAFATDLTAGPRGYGCPPRRRCGYGGYRPCYYGGCYRGGCSRDLANAAAITSIVANGISIIDNLTYPRAVAPVYAQPVYTQPIYTPTQVIVPARGPLPPGMIIGPGAPAVRYYGY